MSERVLLVEDRQSLRTMLASALSKRFIVDEAGDLPAGLALQGPTWARVAWGARAAVERAREEAWARVGSRGR